MNLLLIYFLQLNLTRAIDLLIVTCLKCLMLWQVRIISWCSNPHKSWLTDSFGNDFIFILKNHLSGHLEVTVVK